MYYSYEDTELQFWKMVITLAYAEAEAGRAAVEKYPSDRAMDGGAEWRQQAASLTKEDAMVMVMVGYGWSARSWISKILATYLRT